MIGLLIQDNAYEQDIRELLMSFYPGETYAHEVKDELEFYVETRLGQGEISVLIWDRDGGRDGMDQGGAAALPAGQGPEEGNPVSAVPGHPTCPTTQQPRTWLRKCSTRCLWSARE